MTSEDFVAGDWIVRLAQALHGWAEAQKPYLRDYGEHSYIRRVGWQSAGLRGGRSPPQLCKVRPSVGCLIDLDLL